MAERLKLEITLVKSNQDKNEEKQIIDTLKSVKCIEKITPQQNPEGKEGNENYRTFFDVTIDTRNFADFAKDFNLRNWYLKLGLEVTNDALLLMLKDYSSFIRFFNANPANSLKYYFFICNEVLSSLQKKYELKSVIVSRYAEHSGIHIWNYQQLFWIGGKSLKDVFAKVMTHIGHEGMSS